MKAYVYINYGRVIADCPVEKCLNAMLLAKGQAVFVCAGAGGCGAQAQLVWPSDMDGIMQALLPRWPQNQNWFPKNHPLAIASRSPHGQTAKELVEETMQNS